MSGERTLRLLLRLGGSVMLLAFPAMLLPTAWMAASHRALGLGEFPASALVEYLTRSISALYGIHGLLLLAVSRDVRRHRPLIVVLGWANLFFGVAMLAIDRVAGLPLWWTLGEGPWIAVFGGVLLALVRKLPAERS